MVRPEFDTNNYMRMVGLMLWLIGVICNTGKSVILDSCFCVLKIIF